VSDASNEETADRVGVLFCAARRAGTRRPRGAAWYESAWAAEGQGKSAFGKLERWAVHTERIGLATGIVNVFSRTPAAIAQAVATLDAHSGGRAVLGLGVAHPGVVEGFHGAEFERPLPRDGRVYRTGPPVPPATRRGTTGSSSRRRGPRSGEAFAPERASIPIYNGALGPGNVRLTGQFADGWVPNLYPDSQFKEAKGWLADGAARGDRDPASIDVAMYVLTAVDEDPERARRAAAEHIAYYLRDIPGTTTAPPWRRVRRRRRRGPGRPSTDAGAERVETGLLDHLAVVGTPGGGAGPTGPPPRDRRRPPDRPAPPGATGSGWSARWKRSRRRDESACCRGESVALCCRDEAIAPCRYVEGSEPLALTHRIMRLLVVLALVNMTKRIWEDLLTERDKQVISAAGYDKEGASSWESRGMGTNPMVLVIDMQRLVVGADEPILNAVEEYRTAMGEIAWNAIDHIEPFLEFSRNHEIPVTYTRVVVRPCRATTTRTTRTSTSSTPLPRKRARR